MVDQILPDKETHYYSINNNNNIIQKQSLLLFKYQHSSSLLFPPFSFPQNTHFADMVEAAAKCILVLGLLLCALTLSSGDLFGFSFNAKKNPRGRFLVDDLLPTVPPASPLPTIVTVPSTNPGGIMPAIPAGTLPAIPTASVPPPAGTIPGAQPITNPVTTFPPPPAAPGAVPATTPLGNSQPPPATMPTTTIPPPPPATATIQPLPPLTTIPPPSPATTTNPPTNPAAGAGQSWCVAKSGAAETALQSALDYACGIGGSDCAQIQQGASCYNPNSLQNHASFAFNSYYQKNPAPTSCDFGGTATVVTSNPSSGSCIYPSSATASTATPISSGTIPGTGSSTGYGSASPAPLYNSASIAAATVRPIVTYIILLASLTMKRIIVDL